MPESKHARIWDELDYDSRRSIWINRAQGVDLYDSIFESCLMSFAHLSERCNPRTLRGIEEELEEFASQSSKNRAGLT